MLVALVAVGLFGLHYAARRLEAAVLNALGPRSSIDSIELRWNRVALRGLRIRGDGRTWPAEDEVRAERIVIGASVRDLWEPGWRIEHVSVERGYVSMQRTRQGKLRVVPALLEKPSDTANTEGTPPRLQIAKFELRDMAVDFHDASLPSGRHRVRIEGLQAMFGPLDLPALDTPMRIRVDALLKGSHRDGNLAIEGELTPATQDARLKASARGVDLIAMQPYLLKLNEGGVRSGTLDLSVQVAVKARHLHAPGKLTLTDLSLTEGGGAFATFAGLPRRAVISALQRDGCIEVAFTLDGSLNDPGFALNESFATRLASGLAENVGVSMSGVVEGAGSVVKGLFGR